MDYLIKELMLTAERQRDLMEQIREETHVMDIDSVRRIKGISELILELEVKRQTITDILAKQLPTGC